MALSRMNQKIAVSVVYVLALFMAVMDITIVNVALPTIGREFGVPSTEVDLVVTSFLVTLAIFIPASGWLGDRFGTKKVLLVALAIFTAASALCGLAHSLPQLVAARALQGVGGGMITPVGLAMLFRVYPPRERIRAARILLVPTAFAPAIGPVLGGLLVTKLSWRWVFFVNVPIGIAAVIFGALVLKEHREGKPGRFDLAGFLLAGIGFASLMYAVSEGPERGWASPVIVITGLVGVLMLAVLVPLELRRPEPMLDMRLLKDRLFRTTSIVVFLMMCSFFGLLFTVVLFYQDGLGLSALQSGLSTFPEAIGVMIGVQVATRIYPRLGPRRVISSGLFGVAAVAAAMTLAQASTSLWYMRILMFCLGYCVAHVMSPTQAAAFTTISPASTGRASGFFNAARQLGGAVGVAGLTTVMIAVGRIGPAPTGHADLAPFHVAFACASALALLNGLFALTIHDSDAAPTMQVARRRGVAEPSVAEPASPSVAGSPA
jgi:EmrB/QacA subfamily drug resistance transporter